MNHDKEQDNFWAAIERLEGGAKNSHDHIKRLFLLSTQQKIAIEQLDHKVDARFDQLEKEVKENQQENRDRFDQLEKEVKENQQESRDRFDQLEKEVKENQQESRDRFDQLELLIRQLLPNANN